MAKRRAHQGVLITVLVVLAVGAGAAAWWQSDTVLLCWGTVRGGQQTNLKAEQMFLVVAINLYRSTMKIDEGSPWPLTGDTSRNVLVATAPDGGTATINRVTGTVSIRRTINGLEVFDGICARSQQRRWCVFFQDNNEVARVAKLVSITDETWQVEQLNPARWKDLARSEWPHCHRIIWTHTA